MTIPYTKLATQPANLDANETALVHTNGTTVAVSVVPKWLDNGAGMTFIAQARWIDGDGTSHQCPFGQEIKTGFSHTVDYGTLSNLTQDVIVRELTYALLGCDLTTQTVDNEQIALVPISPEGLITVNILNAITVASNSGTSDVGAALGL